jgi:hypothetical protein
MRGSRWVALLASVLIAGAESGCSNATSDPTPKSVPDFQTDSTSYTLVGNGYYQANVGVTFTNRNAESVTFENCGGETALHLEKFSGGAWISAFAPLVHACLSPPIIVAVNGQHSMSFSLVSGLPETNTAPKFSVPEIPGTYRVVWDDESTAAGGSVSLDHRISNTFTLSLKQ